MFTINDCLTLVQTAWYTSIPDTLVLLTSDNFIRLSNLAEPNLPLLEVPLLPSSASVQLHHHGLVLNQECVVAFSLWKTSAFILHESGDVSLVSLARTTYPRKPPQVLRMHPQADDNYTSNPSSILLLNVAPLFVVVADKTGIVYHCVYLHENPLDQEVGTENLKTNVYEP